LTSGVGILGMGIENPNKVIFSIEIGLSLTLISDTSNPFSDAILVTDAIHPKKVEIICTAMADND
jgi:hypothetical protein